MRMLQYYNYILSKFMSLTGNKETAEDYTQELYLNYCKYKHKSRTNHIGYAFVNLLIKHTYYKIIKHNRWSKRNGETVPLESYVGVFAYETPYVERIFTRELLEICNNLPEGRLKYAISYVLDKEVLTKDEWKYKEIIKYNRGELLQYV